MSFGVHVGVRELQTVHYHRIRGKKNCCKGLAALEAAEGKLEALGCRVAGRSAGLVQVLLSLTSCIRTPTMPSLC